VFAREKQGKKGRNREGTDFLVWKEKRGRTPGDMETWEEFECWGGGSDQKEGKERDAKQNRQGKEKRKFAGEATGGQNFQDPGGKGEKDAGCRGKMGGYFPNLTQIPTHR